VVRQPVAARPEFRRLVASTLHALQPASRRLLDGAAVIGQEVGVPLLEAVTGSSPAEDSTAAVEHDQAAKVVITRQWRYLGTGWKTTADAALALAAADAARSRQPAGLSTTA
jgi:hypothetical protein